MFKKSETTVLVLRGADEAARAVREALATASEAERPGLELAARLITEADTLSEAELRGRWAQRKLTDAGHQGPPDSVHAIKALRKAEPTLSLSTAVQLSRDAAALGA